MTPVRVVARNARRFLAYLHDHGLTWKAAQYVSGVDVLRGLPLGSRLVLVDGWREREDAHEIEALLHRFFTECAV